jgi:hypothetical protein
MVLVDIVVVALLLVVTLLLVLIKLLDEVWLVATWVEEAVDVLLADAVAGGRDPEGEP